MTRPLRLIAFMLVLALTAVRPVIAQETTASLEHSLLWMQTSAEYRALCLQTYHTATAVIAERLRLANAVSRTPDFGVAQVELVGSNDAAPPSGPSVAAANPATAGATGTLRFVNRPVAVVMDLDETVFDNSPYEAALLQQERPHDAATFSAWLAYQAAAPQAQRSVPGAVAFIKAVEAMGVTVIYISDRSIADGGLEKAVRVLRGLGVRGEALEQRLWLQKAPADERAAALAVLRRLGVGEDSPVGRQMLAAQSHKQLRRLEAMKTYQVVGYFGDDLGDFPAYVPRAKPLGHPMVDARRQAVEDEAAHWGTDWFVLPNPVYGHWAPGLTLPSKNLLPMLDDAGFGAKLKTIPSAH